MGGGKKWKNMYSRILYLLWYTTGYRNLGDSSTFLQIYIDICLFPSLFSEYFSLSIGSIPVYSSLSLVPIDEAPWKRSHISWMSIAPCPIYRFRDKEKTETTAHFIYLVCFLVSRGESIRLRFWNITGNIVSFLFIHDTPSAPGSNRGEKSTRFSTQLLFPRIYYATCFVFLIKKNQQNHSLDLAEKKRKNILKTY